MNHKTLEDYVTYFCLIFDVGFVTCWSRPKNITPSSPLTDVANGDQEKGKAFMPICTRKKFASRKVRKVEIER